MIQKLQFGPWRIWYDPPPIPARHDGVREVDWHYQDDNEETRGGSCPSVQACLEEIWDYIELDATPAQSEP